MACSDRTLDSATRVSHLHGRETAEDAHLISLAAHGCPSYWSHSSCSHHLCTPIPRAQVTSQQCYGRDGPRRLRHRSGQCSSGGEVPLIEPGGGCSGHSGTQKMGLLRLDGPVLRVCLNVIKIEIEELANQRRSIVYNLLGRFSRCMAL